jgi:hypothetical protein
MPYHLDPLVETATAALAGGSGEFALTAESIQELKRMVALLDERDLAPQIAGVERKTATEELAEAIAKLYEQFGEAVDPMMRQYRQVNPTFFTEYTNASADSAADTEADASEVHAEAEAIRRDAGISGVNGQAALSR